MKQLTKRQQEIFDFIKDCQSEGYTPTRREIADNFGFKSDNAAQEHLTLLERKGYIELVKTKSRRIKVLIWKTG